MSIICQICKKEFKSIINNTHLKIHNISVDEYKQKFGSNSTVSDEYRKSISERNSGEKNPNFNKNWSNEQRANLSEKNRGKVPVNKGKKVNYGNKFLESIRHREEKYKSGELTRVISEMTEDRKRKISKSVKKYAESNSTELKTRAYKALETKKQNGIDLAFWRGKKHSPETLKKLKENSIKSNTEKKLKSYERITAHLLNSNLELLSSISDSQFHLKCTMCLNQFAIGKQYFNDSKFKLDRCPVCFPRQAIARSAAEEEIYQFINMLAGDAVPNARNIVKGEIDIFVPSKNLAIEFNGIYWHSEPVLESLGKSKTSDNEKRIRVKNAGLRYIGIFEDEWKYKQEIVKSRLSGILGFSTTTINGRQCVVKEISSKESSMFCDANHIQGKGRSNIRYGLFYKEELLSVMTFSKNNISRKINNWEINRFCTKINHRVHGAASKLFKQFIKDHDPDSVISYADSRWSDGDLYKMLGFNFEKDTVPNYWYVYGGSSKRVHRYSLRKNKNDDQTKTEKELRTVQGYYRIWDCGSSKWIWKRGE